MTEWVNEGVHAEVNDMAWSNKSDMEEDKEGDIPMDPRGSQKTTQGSTMKIN